MALDETRTAGETGHLSDHNDLHAFRNDFDFATSAPSTGDVLEWDGTQWVPGSATFAAEVDTVSTQETTTSDTYTDLATAGPAVTITVGDSGIVEVSLSVRCFNDTATGYAKASFATSGDVTEAADDEWAIEIRAALNSNPAMRAGAARLLTGLTPGDSLTFTAKYRRAVDGTASFLRRAIHAKTW